ncbi:hypothetical protein PR003_g17061 [Phytophthora rubi]|uniref:Uncharacterized protein n=1 Tax=Phytophthora rubi TaxID=129364 RepID=A0A6A4EBD1_9STRA|nr:hypothetical protein PR003_g17061 [Phytophthora rubi]
MNTVFFGQQIDGAAAFNHDLLYEQGLITARDTLAAAIPWIFDPVPDIMHSPSATTSTNSRALLLDDWREYAWRVAGKPVDCGGTVGEAGLRAALSGCAAHQKSLIGVSGMLRTRRAIKAGSL